MEVGASPGRTRPKWTALVPTLPAGLPRALWQPVSAREFLYRYCTEGRGVTRSCEGRGVTRSCEGRGVTRSCEGRGVTRSCEGRGVARSCENLCFNKVLVFVQI